MSVNPIVHWELMGADGDAQKAFYEANFDWKLEAVDGFDGYHMVSADDVGVGGAVGQGNEQMPNYMTIYIQVDSIDEALSGIEASGGATVMPRTEIPGVVTFGLFNDPAGNLVGLVEEDTPGSEWRSLQPWRQASGSLPGDSVRFQGMLRQVHADTSTVDLLDLYLSDTRSVPDRPWVMVNMISSIDGAIAIGGRSTGLGDDDDPQVFRAIRAVPDVILVGAGTVTAEDYAPVTLDDERRERRVAWGKTEVPTLAVVSGRLSIDPEARLFSDPEHKALIITSTMADPAKLVMLGDAADVAILPSLDPESILGHLGAANVVLLEGGPTLNAQFAGAGLVDEMNLTLRSAVVAGDSKRITSGPDIDPILEMTVDRVLQGDRSLFIRYLKTG